MGKLYPRQKIGSLRNKMNFTTPPRKIASLKPIKKTLIAAALISLFNSTYAAEDFIYTPEVENTEVENYDGNIDRVLNLNSTSQIPNEYQNINIELTPTIENDRYTVAVDGKTLTVHGSTNIHLSAQMPPDENSDGMDWNPGGRTASVT